MTETKKNNNLHLFNGNINTIAKNNKEDDDFIEELLDTINTEIKDISATCLKDLTTISTSDHALTGVITHEKKEGLRNYSTSERELSAIVHIKQYVYGRHFTILNRSADAPAPRLTRLQNRLKLYDYTIEYRSGNENGNANVLSRMVEEEDEDTNDILDDDQEIVINLIKLKNTDSMATQLEEIDLKWIYDKKREEIKTGSKPKLELEDRVVDGSQSVISERELLSMQWNRIYVLNNFLYRFRKKQR